MQVHLNRIDGIDDAIISMFLSKRTLTRELEMDIRQTVNAHSYQDVSEDHALGALKPDALDDGKLVDWLTKVTKWGEHHITMLRFVDLSFTVYDLHRAGQDDWDAHAYRYNNRIIRSSTRLGNFNQGEMSDWYKGKIIPTDAALGILGMQMPDYIEYEGQTYVRGANGYILEGHENDKDYKRGLYMLSIPSCFIFRCQLTEFGHVYRERKGDGTANPEVKMVAEQCADQIDSATLGFVDREKLIAIRQ